MRFNHCSAKSKNWMGKIRIISEIKGLSRYLEDPLAPNQREPTNEDNLQLAFLLTFPKNICLAADEELEYPFYLMVKDKNLLKVHGSSVITLLAPKPKWVCCQNLVLSSVTGRPMARLLVPINERLLQKSSEIDLKKALKMDKDRLPQKIVLKGVSTAFIRFLRSKNHNEFIQKELQKQSAYLETDEDKELLLYFYTKELKKEAEQSIEIKNMVKCIGEHMDSMVTKKNYLFPVGDRTKIQVNHKGIIIDVLSSQEYLSFLIKSNGRNLITLLNEHAEQFKIVEDMYSYAINKEKNITTVHVNNKVNSRILFEAMNRECRKKKIVCKINLRIGFPICGYASDHTSKFKKWKIELQWFEGPKSKHARIYCEVVDTVDYVYDHISKNRDLRYLLLI